MMGASIAAWQDHFEKQSIPQLRAIYKAIRRIKLDLTFGQFNRPEHDIEAKPFWAGPADLPGCLFEATKLGKSQQMTAIYYWDEFREKRLEIIKKGIKKFKGGLNERIKQRIRVAR